MIIFLIQRSVRNLYFDFGFEYGGDFGCNLPRLLFTCKTLVDLTLVNCGVIPSSGKLFLPSLKKLNLSYVKYKSDESLPHLLSDCLVLEELIVYYCFRVGQKNSECIIVPSPAIKTLTVDFSSPHNLEEMLIIDVPALTYLKANQCNLDCMKSLSKTMTSLIEAEIDLKGKWHTCAIDCNEHGSSVEFLSCLWHVKYLKIASDHDTLVDIVGTGSMPKFVNLTILELNLTINWYNVVKFLEVVDYLEVLIINTRETIPYKEPKRVPTCMLSCLRTVRMNDFSGCDDVFDTVRYILRHAQVLEMMEISYPASNDEEKFDALQRISLFERASESCQVAFHTDEIVSDVINTRNRERRKREEERELT